ncbi:uncharacterized protein [Drosophila tropicalis]|uniref:uncharacterized protein n=1 Tax=Drosophila tropicalis TaxID=46794 RepID=UPI0035ABCB85
MRSHVAVYGVPDNLGKNCIAGLGAAGPFARYPTAPTNWTSAGAPKTPQPTCYNVQHHGPPTPTPIQWPGPTNYGLNMPSSMVNQQRINECAGIPLISNATSHLSQRQRLLRKLTKPLPSGPPQSVVPQTWPTPPTTTTANPTATMVSAAVSQLSGMPLLQQTVGANHKPHPHHCWPTYQAQPPSGNFKQSRALRYQNSAPAVLPTQTQQQQQHNEKLIMSQGSAQMDQDQTCLPRIIKPRKRRKKDRKPANGVLIKLDTDQLHNQHLHHHHQQQQQQQQQQQFHHHHHQQHSQMLRQNFVTSSASGTIFNHSLDRSQVLPTINGNGSHSWQHDHSHGVCFCRDCDPLRSLWAHPLRRSLSDASHSEKDSRESSSSSSSVASTHSDSSCDSISQEPTEEFAPITGHSKRAEIVGVIGSQRSQVGQTHNHHQLYQHEGVGRATVTGPTQCLSDDSGYGDILSGINIANDLFKNCFRHRQSATSVDIGDGGVANAESLLNESINEISRKLIETCSVSNEFNGGDGGGAAGSGSDSGLDSASSYNCDSTTGLVFNFEHLNLTDAATPTSLDFSVDCNNNKNYSDSNEGGKGATAYQQQSQQQQQQFYNNCFDLLWHGNHDDSQLAAAILSQDDDDDGDSNNNNKTTTPTKLILGTSMGKLKPPFSTIS